jgi:hypothetical protein
MNTGITIGAVCIVFMLGGAPFVFYPVGEVPVPKIAIEGELTEPTYGQGDYAEAGYSEENSISSYTVYPSMDGAITWMYCTLIWEDEDPVGPLFTNHPDKFQLIIHTSTGTEVSSELSGEGLIELHYEEPSAPTEDDPPASKLNYVSAFAGPWVIEIVCGECGDQESLFGLRVYSDGGNAWDLYAEYGFYAL